MTTSLAALTLVLLGVGAPATSPQAVMLRAVIEPERYEEIDIECERPEWDDPASAAAKSGTRLTTVGPGDASRVERRRQPLVPVNELLAKDTHAERWPAGFTANDVALLRRLEALANGQPVPGPSYSFTRPTLPKLDAKSALAWSQARGFPKLTSAKGRFVRKALEPGDLCEKERATTSEEDDMGCDLVVQRLDIRAQVVEWLDEAKKQPRLIHYGARIDGAGHLCESTEEHTLLEYAPKGTLSRALVFSRHFVHPFGDNPTERPLMQCKHEFAACCSRLAPEQPDVQSLEWAAYEVWTFRETDDKRLAIDYASASFNASSVRPCGMANAYRQARFLP